MSRPKPAIASVPPARPALDYSACADALQHAIHAENVEGGERDATRVATLALLCEVKTLSDAIWHLSEADCGLNPDATITALSWMIRLRTEAAMQLLGE